MFLISSHTTHTLLKLYLTLIMRYVLLVVLQTQTAGLYVKCEFFSGGAVDFALIVDAAGVLLYPPESAWHHQLVR